LEMNFWELGYFIISEITAFNLILQNRARQLPLKLIINSLISKIINTEI
jgi:hypothetical protein